MRPSRRDIIIATRKSSLAMAQSEAIGKQIHQFNPRVSLQLVPIESEGDQVLDHPLAQIGGKGLFTRNIETALCDGKIADIAVHSLKDLPTQETPGLLIVATPPRAPVHDVLISRGPTTIDELPPGAVVGTCSPRRKAQLLRRRPDLQIVHLRGNVQTRLRKVLEEKVMDATLLAAAGLGRLGLGEHAANAIPVDQMLPACGQGALAVQCRVDDHTTVRRCMPLNDAATSIAVNAERSVAAALGADCHSPVAILAQLIDANTLRLRARVLSTDGTQCAEVDLTGPSKKLRPLVEEVTASLIAQGAKALLEKAARDGAADDSTFNV